MQYKGWISKNVRFAISGFLYIGFWASDLQKSCGCIMGKRYNDFKDLRPMCQKHNISKITFVSTLYLYCIACISVMIALHAVQCYQACYIIAQTAVDDCIYVFTLNCMQGFNAIVKLHVCVCTMKWCKHTWDKEHSQTMNLSRHQIGWAVISTRCPTVIAWALTSRVIVVLSQRNHVLQH